jgi:hypothetical protein
MKIDETRHEVNKKCNAGGCNERGHRVARRNAYIGLKGKFVPLLLAQSLSKNGTNFPFKPIKLDFKSTEAEII